MNFIKKIISPCILVICMIVVMMFVVTPTKASDASNESIQVETLTNYSVEGLNTLIDTQAANGYLYSGLFKSGTTVDNLTKQNVVASPKSGSTYVAKFVPEGVMGIKAQVSSALLSNSDLTASSVRMVTAVDSLTYKEIGFSITRVGNDGQPIELVNQASITPYVYEKLYGVDVTVDNPGEPMEYTPKDIHTLANYFKTYTIKNVPDSAYNTELTVVPYWKTFDGKTVYGATGVKSVNLGRSWVYVNATAHTDGNEYGTYEHPFAEEKFATALDNITLDKTGTILLQSNYTVPKGFDWKSHEKDIIVTSVDGTQTLSFGDATESIRDGVTFIKMTLLLPTSSVYACGNNFTIESGVTSDNSNTVIYGGAYNAEVESTNVTIKSGAYRAIYGGGALAGGIVKKNTNVTLEHCNIYNTASDKSHDSRVHGGGNKATVKGNTNVTIGAGFNENLDYTSHDMHSTVYGGGFGDTDNIAIVEGHTYVTIRDGAKVNYVFGAGGPLSEVQGTSHIIFDGGYAMGLYGGANGSGLNSHTSVKMLEGQVQQIFGGNQGIADNSMTGNADVQVLGGTVTRRIYGGCYNEYAYSWNTANSVIGYTSVTIASEATIPSGNVCANSRLGTKSENEIGVMVLNPGKDSGCIGRDVGSSLCTNFLVEVPVGGTVTSETGLLNIATDTEKGYNYATITYAGETLCVIQGKGKCPLPTLNNTTSIQNIEVTFSKELPTVDGFEAKNVNGTNATYYPTFEEAMAMAEDGTNVVVSQNINVDRAYTIEKDLTISSESAITITKAVTLADNMFTVTAGKFSIDGTSDATITLEGNKDADGAIGARAIRVEDGAICETNYVTIQNFSVEGSAGAVSCSGTLKSADTTFANNNASATSGATGGAIYASEDSNVTVIRCQFTNNTASNGGGAIHIISKGTVTSNNSVFSGNKTTNKDNGNGGVIYCQGTYNDTNSSYVDNESARHGGAIIVQPGANATIVGSDANAQFSGNTATANANGNAVYVNSGATISITGYSFADNTQKVLAAGTLTFNDITGATIVQGSAGKIYVAGYDEETNAVEIKPNSYTIGKEVLLKAEKLEDDSIFEAACEDITITTDSDNNFWWIKSDGTLMRGVARIETGGVNEYYNTLEAAVEVANTNGGTGDADDIVIYVYKDVALSARIDITKNINIQNESGETIIISRGTIGADKDMFYVGNSSNNLAVKLTLGTMDGNEEGALIVDGTGASSGRMVDNRGSATFVLGKNATMQNATSSNWGAVLINRGTGVAELYGSIKNNTCTGAGGAVLQHGTGKLTIYEGTYTNNYATREASGNTTASYGGFLRADAGLVDIQGGTFTENNTVGIGGVLWADSDAIVGISGGNFTNNTAGDEGSAIYCLGTLNCTDATFEGETVQTVYVNGEFTFDHITGVTIVQGEGATLNVAGYDATNVITVTPNAHTAGVQLLNKVSAVEDAIFEAACAGIKVTPDADNNDWWIDSDGVLMKGEARIGDTYYNTLSDAVETVNSDDSISAEETVVIELIKDIELDAQIQIKKNIAIQNISGQDVKITRGKDAASITLFYVTETLTLGTNDENETGKLVVDGKNTPVQSRFIDNRGNATFVLGKNATLENANSNQWGTVLCNRGTATLYGVIKNNICTGDGGAIIQVQETNKATPILTIVEGKYIENESTNENVANPHGAVLRANAGEVIIQGGSFTDNSTVGLGSVIHSTVAVTITGGTFSNNISHDDSALYCTGTLSCTDATFEGEAEQTIYANGTFTFNNITGATIVQGESGTIVVEGSDNIDTIIVIPYEYTVGKVVLTKADGVEDSVFEAACANISVTKDTNGDTWYLDDNGALKMAIAQIGNVCFDSWRDAIAYANENGETGEADAIVICLYSDLEISETVEIQKNIMLRSESAVTITRSESLTGSMFNVTNGTFGIIGTSVANITIEGNRGTTPVTARAVKVASGATLNIEYVRIQNFYSTQGGAIYCAGTATVTKGILESNEVTGQGGAIYISETGSVTSDNSTFYANTAGGNGGAVNCYKGTFIDTNSSYIENTGAKGGALIVMSGGTATLTGTDTNAKFSNNSVTNVQGSAIFAQGTVNVEEYSFEGEVLQKMYVTGTLNYSNLTGTYEVEGSGAITEK